jgi:uncharacterized protein YndB with AHSA1/START domain
MTTGSLITGGAHPAIRLERHLSDPPSVVWQALTDREELRAWFPCDVIVEGGRWTPGAAITFVFPPEVIDLTLHGEVLAVAEPTSLAYSWGEGETLRFELSAEGEGTLLVLIDELPAAFAARNAAGWEECLDRLAGRTPAAEGWRPLFEAYTDMFTPALGAQEGPPADMHA